MRRPAKAVLVLATVFILWTISVPPRAEEVLDDDLRGLVLELLQECRELRVEILLIRLERVTTESARTRRELGAVSRRLAETESETGGAVAAVSGGADGPGVRLPEEQLRELGLLGSEQTDARLRRLDEEESRLTDRLELIEEDRRGLEERLANLEALLATQPVSRD